MNNMKFLRNRKPVIRLPMLKKLTRFGCMLLILTQLLPMAVFATGTELPDGESYAPRETTAEEFVQEDKFASVPLFLQTDYPDDRYGDGTIATSGCGITCVAMVASYLTGYDYTPDILARYFGGNAENNIVRLENASDALQLPYWKSENVHKTIAALKNGKIAIAMMGSNSVFTSTQHFIVLTGITEDGKILVNDPNGANYENWQLQNGLKNGFREGDIICGYSGAWIYDPDAMPEEPYYYCEEDAEANRYSDFSLSENEIELLAKFVWWKARDESTERQQAVAETILNRMVSQDFPNSLLGVIHEEEQFYSATYFLNATPTQVQYDVVDQALNGPYVLPVSATHFSTN